MHDSPRKSGPSELVIILCSPCDHIKLSLLPPFTILTPSLFTSCDSDTYTSSSDSYSYCFFGFCSVCALQKHLKPDSSSNKSRKAANALSNLKRNRKRTKTLSAQKSTSKYRTTLHEPWEPEGFCKSLTLSSFDRN